MRIRKFLLGIGALAVIGSLNGCILVERGGRHCELPAGRMVCDAGHWGR